MIPTAFVSRNCVKSPTIFLSAFVCNFFHFQPQEPSPFFCRQEPFFCVCNFFHFHRIFCFGSNKHHSPRHVALRLRLLPLLVVDIFPESDPFLDRSSPAVQGDYMARYNYAPVMSNPVLVWEVFLSLNECQPSPI